MKKRTWFRLHSFTGVITGLLLFVICWSGTFAVVSNELDWLAIPEMRVTPGEQYLSWAEIESAAKTVLPQATVSSLHAPVNSRAVATVWMEQPDGSIKSVLVNPYNGEVTSVSQGRYTIQRFFRSFHMAFFLPGIGLYLVTAFGVTLFLSLIAGLMFYKRWWTRFFRFKSGSGRVFWSELHKTSGLWSIWFVLLISLTSVWYLFEISRLDFGDGKVRYAGVGDYAAVQIPAPKTSDQLVYLTLDELLAQVEQKWSGFRAETITYDWPVEGALSLEGRAGVSLVRARANQIHLSREGGEILLQHRWNDLPVYWLWSDMADPLHFGNFAGLWSKLLWFAFGLVLSGLILTGTYLHSRRLMQEAGGRRRHRWPGTLAAILVSVLLLMLTLPFGLFEAKEYYGLTIDGVKRLPVLQTGVRIVILLWVFTTLLIIAVWARSFCRAMQIK